ncbi:hypothetical protein ABZY90_20710 [Streptomyces sp. NPDC006422]|uniref:hypothetical protein n=1 Tax=unclassified Streptomyces TaxID=2593676 RepID=UPI0033AB5478
MTRAVPEVAVAARDEPGTEWLASGMERIEPPAVLHMTHAERLLASASDLLHRAGSVRMATDMRKGAQRVRTDMRIDREGNCVGGFDGGPGNRGTLVVLAGPEPEAYMRFSETALAELQTMADGRGATVSARVRDRIGQMRGKYVKARSGPKGAEALAKGCAVPRLIGAGEDEWKGARELAPVRRDGRRVIPLVPGPDEGTEGVAYVDAGGKPYLRSLRAKEAGMTADLRFSAYGAPVTVRRPAASDVVEFADEGSMFAL